MGRRNKLSLYKAKDVQKAFNSINNGKRSVADVAEQFGVHPTTIRYHLTKETYTSA